MSFVAIVQTAAGNTLRFNWKTVGTSTWSPEVVATSIFSAPSAAQAGNSVVIAAQGPNNSLMFYWQTVGTKPWNAEQVAGANTTFSAPAVAVVGNSVVIAAQGPGNSLMFYWQTIGTPAGGNWYGEPRNFLVRVDGKY